MATLQSVLVTDDAFSTRLAPYLPSASKAHQCHRAGKYPHDVASLEDSILRDARNVLKARESPLMIYSHAILIPTSSSNVNAIRVFGEALIDRKFRCSRFRLAFTSDDKFAKSRNDFLKGTKQSGP
jgi:hypothetical protein